MRVEIINNPDQFPQFEAQNVFQTEEYMRLFEHEKGTKVVLFAVHKNILQETNKECSVQNCSPELGELPEAEGSVNSQLSTLNSQLVLVQPLIINRYYRNLPGKFASYAVAWREPWRNPEISDVEAQKAFVLLTQAIEQYCRPRALYLEYRHFPDNNIYHDILSCYYKLEEKKRTQSKRRLSTFYRQWLKDRWFNFQLSTFKFLPWFNIYNQIQPDEDVMLAMSKKKRQQLRQSLATSVQIEQNPTDEQIAEWYALLQRLYRRIHRPLPSLQLFLRLNQSSIGKLIIIIHKGRVISGCAMLVFKQNNSQLVYDWYRASIAEDIEGIYPSVVSTWSALQYLSDQGGGTFDFMGAGPQNKYYGVRDFKLKFGGTLINEYRYRKYLL